MRRFPKSRAFSPSLGDVITLVRGWNWSSDLDEYKVTLRRLAVRDDRYIETLLQDDDANAMLAGLDDRSRALVRIAALVASDAAPPAYMNCVEAARRAGISHDEIAGVLIAVLPLVGIARVVSAAPNLGLALGYDVAEALEVV
jgi:4-carboxymuconolactone decarboxylase